MTINEVGELTTPIAMKRGDSSAPLVDPLAPRLRLAWVYSPLNASSEAPANTVIRVVTSAGVPLTAQYSLVDPKGAAELLSLYNRFENQRKQRDKRIEQYAAAMNARRFRQGTVIDFVVWNEQTWLVNGQHTLSAIVESGVAQFLLIQCRNVKTAEQLAEQYGTHDRNLTRTPSEILQASSMMQKTNLSSRQVDKYHAATKFIANDFATPTQFPGQAFDVLAIKDKMLETDLVVAAGLYFSAISSGRPAVARRLMNAASVAVGIATFCGDRMDLASEFWKSTAENDGLRIGDPQYALVEFFQTWKPNVHSDITVCRVIAYCWNKFYRSEPIRQLRQDAVLKPYGAKAGVEIFGTRFKAR